MIPKFVRVSKACIRNFYYVQDDYYIEVETNVGNSSLDHKIVNHNIYVVLWCSVIISINIKLSISIRQGSPLLSTLSFC